tara:strand:- start:2216 stop:2635 length:420 start_codon:yes stop_codon:yes gene_type:complete
MKKLFLVILLIPILGYSQSRKSTIDSCVTITHKLVNEHRVKHRSEPLILSDTLTKLAQARAEYMYKTGEYNHDGMPKGCSGENIGDGRDFDLYFELPFIVAQTVDGYSNSAGHNENMLFYAWTESGYGFYKGYTVQLFK